MAKRLPVSEFLQDSRATRSVEALLVAALGTPRRTLRDVHTELMVVDKQRALLGKIFERRASNLFSIEEVELIFDSIEEYGQVQLPQCLFGDDQDEAFYAPPPLTAGELREVLALCALRGGMDPRDLVVKINQGMVSDQVRLRSEMVACDGPVKRRPASRCL